MSDVSTFAPRLSAGLSLFLLLLRSHSQSFLTSLLSAFPELLLVSRPPQQVSPLCRSHRDEQATGTTQGFPNSAASITPLPPLSPRPLIWKEGPGHCLAGTLVKANLPQSFSRGFICSSLFAFCFSEAIWL